MKIASTLLSQFSDIYLHLRYVIVKQHVTLAFFTGASESRASYRTSRVAVYATVMAWSEGSSHGGLPRSVDRLRRQYFKSPLQRSTPATQSSSVATVLASSSDGDSSVDDPAAEVPSGQNMRSKSRSESTQGARGSHDDSVLSSDVLSFSSSTSIEDQAVTAKVEGKTVFVSFNAPKYGKNTILSILEAEIDSGSIDIANDCMIKVSTMTSDAR